MKISIVTPTFNSAKTIEATLKSVKNQTYKNYEHIIIDNCSSDSTLEILTQYSEQCPKIKVYSEPDLGISDAFNKGIIKSSGDIVAILNSDDFYEHSKVFEKVIEILHENSDIDFVHGDINFIDCEYGNHRRRPLMCPITYAMPFNHPTMFIRKSLYQELGLFDIKYKIAMDYEFVLRMYTDPSNCSKKYIYSPSILVNMKSGGVSDKREIESLQEIKQALCQHNFWGPRSSYFVANRKSRVYAKIFFKRIGLKKIISIWRHYKWK